MRHFAERRERNPVKEIASESKSLSHLGVCLWSFFVSSGGSFEERLRLGTEARLGDWWKNFSQGHRVPRVSRALFPLPSCWGECLTDFPVGRSFEEILHDEELGRVFGIGCWCELAVLFLNHLYNASLGFGPKPTSKAQDEFLRSIEGSVKRWLADDARLIWKGEDIERDFARKTVSYTGEEICKAEPLSVYRVAPALPPVGHGGAINCTAWVDGATKWYLENPKACLLPDTGQDLPRLRAKVHIAPGEELELAKLLVERNVCCWVESEKVCIYRGERVLNGLFGVPKSTILANHQTSLRCIMNLIPSNSILRQIPGKVHKLPSVTQWLHVCLGPDESISLCQNDMVSAFYLFSLPPQWSELLSFDLSFTGKELGMESALHLKRFNLACKVLPMGWTSAVGVMQEIAERVLHAGGVPEKQQIIRGRPIPEWMVNVCQEAQKSEKVWWHVYLDNYASGEKVATGKEAQGRNLQMLVEDLWEAAGIVSSKSKVVSEEGSATELGAFIGGHGNWIGAGPERLLKLAKSTLWILSRQQISKKVLQITMGRWVFAMQFRRPFMSHYERAWQIIGGKKGKRRKASELQQELLLGVFGLGLPFLHTWLGARVDSETTCSDASSTGGAVAVSRNLSTAGNSFLNSQSSELKATNIPVVLISLFNGIGGASRCYDLAGVKVRGVIFADTHAPANRVYNRRWPGGYGFSDVRDITAQALEDCLIELEPFEEIHLWVGFPCVDLSSARAGRLNLEGPSSGLTHEALRIRKEVKELFPRHRVRHVFENVASMDVEARDAITALVGDKPYKLDPTQQVPMSRPRFCWTDIDIFETSEVELIEEREYITVNVVGDWPREDSWLDEGSSALVKDMLSILHA